MTTDTETPYQLLPPLPDDIYEQLKADIAEHGIRVPIDVDEDGTILDGHHRAWIALDLGIDCPKRVVAGLTEEQKREHAVKVNALRRSLDRQQRRELVARLRESGMTQQRISHTTGIPQQTVSRDLADVTQMGNTKLPATITDSLGRQQPAVKPRPIPRPEPAAEPDAFAGADWTEPDDEQIPGQSHVLDHTELETVTPAVSVKPTPAEPLSLAETNKLLPPSLITQVRDADRRATAAMRITDPCEELARISNPEHLAQNAPDDMAHRVATVRPAIEILTRFITAWENR